MSHITLPSFYQLWLQVSCDDLPALAWGVTHHKTIMFSRVDPKKEKEQFLEQAKVLRESRAGKVQQEKAAVTIQAGLPFHSGRFFFFFFFLFFYFCCYLNSFWGFNYYFLLWSCLNILFFLILLWCCLNSIYSDFALVLFNFFKQFIYSDFAPKPAQLHCREWWWLCSHWFVHPLLKFPWAVSWSLCKFISTFYIIYINIIFMSPCVQIQE